MAGGRRARQSRVRRSQRQTYGRRPVGTQAPLPIVVLICDDSSTAPAYFTVLSREVKQHVTLRIVPASRQGASPLQVVDRAIEKAGELRRGQQASERLQDAVWAMFDSEREPYCREQAREAKKRGESRGVQVIVSDPCYEVWTLLHLEDTGKDFIDCAHVVARIGQLWRSQFGQSFERKAQADYARIIGARLEAAARAKQHREAGDPSWTDVYKIIEHIERQVAQAADR